MSDWVRQGDPGQARVSATVKKDTDPDLYHFIRGLPYGVASAHVKAALRLYLAQMAQTGAAGTSNAAPLSPPASPIPPASLPARDTPVAAPAPLPSSGVQASDLDAASIEPASLALLQSMNNQFS